MVKEAEQFSSDDKKRREAAEARNQADSLVHATERQLAEHGDKVDAETKAGIEAAVAEVKAVLDSGDAAQISAKAQALAQVAMKLGEAVYAAEQAKAAEPAAEAAPAEDVVDADFTEVDDSKK
jgi:molecular chaperone DnaK